MILLLIALVVSGSAVPAILIVQELGFEWTNLEMWKHVTTSFVTGEESIPMTFMIALAWSVMAPITATVFGYAGLRRISEEIGRARNVEVVKRKRKKPKPTQRKKAREKDTARDAAPAEHVPEKVQGNSGEAERLIEGGRHDGAFPIIQSYDEIVQRDRSEGDAGAAGDEAPEAPQKTAGTKKSGLGKRISRNLKTAAARTADKRAQHHQDKTTETTDEGDSRPADKRQKTGGKNTDRPIRMSRLREHVKEITQDTRAMVEDVIDPQNDDEDWDMAEARETGDAAQTPRPQRRENNAKTGRRKGLSGWFGNRGNTKNGGAADTAVDPHERVGGAGDKDDQNVGFVDSDVETEATETPRAVASEILAFYAMWTSAGQGGRTDKMRKQARKLASKVTDDVSGYMVQEFGMRGFAALNTLRSAAGVKEEPRTGQEGPAKPMPKPDETDLREAGFEDEDPGDDEQAPKTQGARHGQFALDEEDINTTSDGDDDNDGDAYEAKDGYQASGSDDADMGVIGGGLMLDDEEEGASEDGAEDAIQKAARSFGGGGQKPAGPAHGVPSSDDKDDEEMPEEAFLGDEGEDADADEDDQGEWGDAPGGMPTGTVSVIDDIDGTGDEDWDEDWGDEDDETETGDTSAAPVTNPGDDADHNEPAEKVSPETQGPVTRATQTPQGTSVEARANEQPGPTIGALGQALMFQIEAVVDYQTRAYAWEQLGEEPPETFDTEDKRKEFLKRSATAIVTLRDQVGEEGMRAVRENLSEEKQKWIDGRADAIMNAMVRGAESEEAHGHMGAHNRPTQDGWVEYRYPDSWKTIAPRAREYRNLATKSEVRFYESAKINPSPRGEEWDHLYDVIDVVVADPRVPAQDGGFRPGIIGVAFAIVPKGAWRVTKIESEEPYGEEWVLQGDGKTVGKVRLRDRALAIFKEWAKQRGRRPAGVLHLIMEDGVEIDGMTDQDAITKHIREKVGSDRDVRVVRQAWDEKEWSRRILPELIGEGAGSA